MMSLASDDEELARVAPDELSRAERLLCAEMVFSALPHFYRLFPVPMSEMMDAIAGQLGRSGTELEQCYLLRRGRTPVALLTAVPAARFAAAKKGGLFSLMRKVETSRSRATLDSLTKFETIMDPVPAVGLYLSRLGTSGPQAIGAGTRLLRRFVEQSADPKLLLHVHNRNPAGWLYRKLGFTPLYSTPREFCCMVLDRDGSRNTKPECESALDVSNA